VLPVKAPDLFLLLLPELDSLLWFEVHVLDEAQVPLLLGCLLLGLLGCCWLLSCWITCGCCIRCRLTSSMVGWACAPICGSWLCCISTCCCGRLCCCIRVLGHHFAVRRRFCGCTGVVEVDGTMLQAYIRLGQSCTNLASRGGFHTVLKPAWTCMDNYFAVSTRLAANVRHRTLHAATKYASATWSTAFPRASILYNDQVGKLRLRSTRYTMQNWFERAANAP
jgi:hypothetical protein